MFNLFSESQMEELNRVAKLSQSLAPEAKVSKKASSVKSEVARMENEVIEYFRDSDSILITSEEQLNDYIDECIKYGYAGIDTETTGTNRIKDYTVGASLYVPTRPNCYIPMRHRIPILETPYKNQLSYESISRCFQRLVDNDCKMIFANADFDLSFIYKDFHVDMCNICFYDVILAWRCLKENELRNGLKELYAKYVLKGTTVPKKFSDFFSPELFPYCRPEVAGLYAGNDAQITFELFKWQLKYIDKDSKYCQKNRLERISDLIWNVEVPLIPVCQDMHRTGIYLDTTTSRVLEERYNARYKEEVNKLKSMVHDVIVSVGSVGDGCPFGDNAQSFNHDSDKHVSYLIFNIMNIPRPEGTKGTGKDVLNQMDTPIAKQILAVRSLSTLISTFVKKLPNSVASDGRIHATFKSIGANCVVGDTLLITPTGYSTISDICESHNCVDNEHTNVDDVTIINMNQEPERASSVIRYTDYPTIKITTEYGFTIEGTFNHPVMVSKYNIKTPQRKTNAGFSSFWEGRYFKKLEDVCIGDYIEIPCNYSQHISSEFQPTNLEVREYKYVGKPSKDVTFPKYYDEDFALFLGMYHADGNTKFHDGTYRIAISNDDDDVISKFKELCKSLFNLDIYTYHAKKREHDVVSYVSSIQISNIDSILSHGANEKKIPDAIYKSPVSVINSYIRGMTLDSSVYIRKNSGNVRFAITVCKEIDARFIQIHLASQGILCGIRREYHSDKSPYFRLIFNADNYILFRDLIGFVESCKCVETIGCISKGNSTKRIGNSFRVLVKSIEKSQNTVYDLHVPNTHSFISNGMISHNTGRMSSADPKSIKAYWGLKIGLIHGRAFA